MLGANACPIQLPIGSEANFLGLIDLIKMKALIWKGEELGAEWDEVEIPAEMKAQADEYHAKMIEKIVEFDDALMERYLNGDMKFTIEELRATLRKGVLQCKIFPVLCASSYKNKGVQPMLDAVCDFLPSPLDLPPTQGHDIFDETKVVERKSGDNEPFSALM